MAKAKKQSKRTTAKQLRRANNPGTINRAKAAAELEREAKECEEQAAQSMKDASDEMFGRYGVPDHGFVMEDLLEAIVKLGEARGLRNAAHDVERLDES